MYARVAGDRGSIGIQQRASAHTARRGRRHRYAPRRRGLEFYSAILLRESSPEIITESAAECRPRHCVRNVHARLTRACTCTRRGARNHVAQRSQRLYEPASTSECDAARLAAIGPVRQRLRLDYRGYGYLRIPRLIPRRRRRGRHQPASRDPGTGADPRVLLRPRAAIKDGRYLRLGCVRFYVMSLLSQGTEKERCEVSY